MFTKDDKIRIIIVIIEYLIIIVIATNLITNPINGGIPPRDINSMIILILSLFNNFTFIILSRELMLFFFRILIIEKIIIK